MRILMIEIFFNSSAAWLDAAKETLVILGVFGYPASYADQVSSQNRLRRFRLQASVVRELYRLPD